MTTYLVKILGVTNEADRMEVGGCLDLDNVIEVKNVLDIGKAVVQLCEPDAIANSVDTIAARDGLYIVTMNIGGVVIVCSAEKE
jgi:hypothetical protein